MKKDNSTYQKHLKLQDRYYIEEGLNKGFTLKTIAEIVGNVFGKYKSEHCGT